MVFKGFEKQVKDGVVIYAVPFLERTGLVRAAFSTRVGGVSSGETATLNLSFKRRDDPATVRENYRLVCEAAGISAQGLVVSKQAHETQVHEVEPGEIGRGVFDEFDNTTADGLMTDRRGVALVKHSADCVSVYILDTKKPAIALVHAGWRGTLNNIAGEAILRMSETYGTDPGDCLCAVGPSIGPCCFEVGEDVAEKFGSRYPGWGLVTREGGAPHVDLWRCNFLELAQAGVPEANIAVAGLCTACDTSTFYSHRKEKGKTGAMAAFLELL